MTRPDRSDRPHRPMVLVALSVAAGAVWGGLPGFAPWHALLALPLCLGERRRLVGLVLVAMALRCAPSSDGIEGGRWRAGQVRFEDQRGRFERGGEPLTLPRGAARDGEWVELLGQGSLLREAAGPDEGGRVVRRAFDLDALRRRAPPLPGVGLGAEWLARLRARALARLDRARDPTTRALLRALLLGERRGLDPQLVDRFTRTGTRHLLALSGLHVGLVSWLVAGPLALALAGFLRLVSRDRLDLPPYLPRALLVLALVPLAGGGPPVTRAAIALALGALAPLLPGHGAGGRGRRADALSLWSLALVLELVAAPAGIWRPGVQLSYTATLALILATGSVARRLQAALPNRGRLARVGRTGRARPEGARVLLQQVVDLLLSGLAASLVASIATLPLVWLHFGEVAPIGVLATPLALFPLVPLIALGWGLVLAPAFVPQVLIDVPVEVLTTLISWADLLPGTPVVLPPRPVALVGLAALLLLTAAMKRGALGRARLAAAISGLLLLPWTLGPSGLELVMLDVGHGTAVLARAPGAGTWLFDAGSRDRVGVARAAVAPLLRRWDCARLTVVVSHLDRDHAGALPWILARWPAREHAGAALTGLGETHDPSRGRLTLPARGALRAVLLRGGTGDGNEGSRHLELTWGATCVLLCGDAEQEGLAKSLEAGDMLGPLDLLLLPHHGSDSPHLEALLATTRPREIWISAGATPAVAPELNRRGLIWTCTADGGPQVKMYGFRTEPGRPGDSGRPSGEGD